MAKYLDNPDGYFRERREQDPPVTLSATEARQGSWGRPVFYVLVCGLILAFIAWGAAEYFGMAIEPPSQSVDTTTTSSTAKDPIENENPVNNDQPAGQPTQTSPTIQDSERM